MTSTDNRRPLDLPEPQALQFGRNHLKTVVCELKFPTLLELETNQPVGIRKALKKEYPLYDVVRSFGFQALGGIMDEQVPKLSSVDKRWSVTIRPAAISLETSSYKSFEELRERVDVVARKALPFLDTDFFTRVGLRYVNLFPVRPEQARKIFNPVLIAPLESGVFGDVDSCFQEIRGVLKTGNYSLRHGYQASEEGPVRYLFDCDFYVEPLEAGSLTITLDYFHLEADSLFQWALTEYGRETLGGSRPKKTGR